MSLWVKICGNTTLEDAQLAAEAGADAVGFVLADSPRQVTVSQVAAITPYLPAALEKIGVFVYLDYATIAAAIEAAGLTGVQLHGASIQGPKLAAKLRARFGAALRILEVVHFSEHAAAELQQSAANPSLDGILVDSRTVKALGGTGIAYDWKVARESLFSADAAMKLVAAGGLNPGNVAEAIAVLKPWGVDVVTGVEAAPGRKDAEKVRAFVRNARNAAR